MNATEFLNRQWGNLLHSELPWDYKTTCKLSNSKCEEAYERPAFYNLYRRKCIHLKEISAITIYYYSNSATKKVFKLDTWNKNQLDLYFGTRVKNWKKF